KFEISVIHETFNISCRKKGKKLFLINLKTMKMATKKFTLFSKMSKVTAFLLSFYFVFPLITNAQGGKQASVWYFGDKAGLDFRQGNPVPLANSAMQSFEGSAVATTVTGDLMFYSNGGSTPYQGGVWNRNHQMMPNGNLTGAGGCNSSFQSSLILPLPRSVD